MLLREILDKSSPQIKTSTKQVQDLLSPKHHAVIGSGAQSLAYLHNKFPNKVIKTIQTYGDSDPSYQFLRLVLKYQHNPYFPKIYSVKQYPTKDQNYRERADSFDELDPEGEFEPPPSVLSYTMYVVMEKLNKLPQITTQDLSVFRIPLTPKFYKWPTGAFSPEAQFRGAFKDPKIRSQLIQHITDPNLKQALRLLEPLFRHFEPDMHRGNIMLRGSQWVFVDPVSHNVSD